MLNKNYYVVYTFTREYTENNQKKYDSGIGTIFCTGRKIKKAKDVEEITALIKDSNIGYTEVSIINWKKIKGEVNNEDIH